MRNGIAFPITDGEFIGASCVVACVKSSVAQQRALFVDIGAALPTSRCICIGVLSPTEIPQELAVLLGASVVAIFFMSISLGRTASARYDSGKASSEARKATRDSDAEHAQALSIYARVAIYWSCLINSIVYLATFATIYIYVLPNAVAGYELVFLDQPLLIAASSLIAPSFLLLLASGRNIF